VMNHNLETVPRLYKQARPGSDYMHSLKLLKDFKARFPDVPTTVVYVPSPASIYSFAAEAIVTGYGSQPTITASPTQVAMRSDLICDLLRAATLAHGAAYVDARPALRKAAKTSLIHGPIDWAHFNKAGQHLLAEVVVQQITGAGAPVAAAQ